MVQNNNTQELHHYGVLGMKWGVHRGNYSKTYAKSAKKLKKMDTKAKYKKDKAARLDYKGLKKETYSFTEAGRRRGRKLQLKANRLNFQAARLEKRGLKFEKEMAKAFAGVKVSEIKPEHLELGKKYAYMLIEANKRPAEKKEKK